jgi:quinohemoprotein ethanol dehydrogenase
MQPRRLLTFALDGKAALPAGVPPDMTVKALDDPSLQLNDADVQAGHAMFNLACATCHGLNLKGAGGPGPDLRESSVALTEDGIWSVVHDGHLISRGMPRIAMLPKQQVKQIYEYIRAGAREALASTKAPNAKPN